MPAAGNRCAGAGAGAALASGRAAARAISARTHRKQWWIRLVSGTMEHVSVALLTLTAAAGLLVPPTRHLAWSGTTCRALLAAAVGLAMTSVLLLLFGDWESPVYTLSGATALLFPAAWFGRTRSTGDEPTDQGEEPGEDEGGGGGSPPTEPDPPPAPSSPELDWDAFDREREGWRELVH